VTSRKIIVLKTGDPVPIVAARRGSFSRMIEETIGASWEGSFETVDGSLIPRARRPSS